MTIRNSTYTVHQNLELELDRNSRDQFYLIYRGERIPDNSFIQVSVIPPVFNKEISLHEIRNAFCVMTYARYRNFDFQVLYFDNGRYFLVTNDVRAARELRLSEFERGSYKIEVPREEIQKMWEERKPSGYGFSFPEGLKEVEEIDF